MSLLVSTANASDGRSADVDGDVEWMRAGLKGAFRLMDGSVGW